MRISFFSTFDNVGGAAIAATRLLDGLRGKNIDAHMYAQRIKTNGPTLASPFPVFDNRLLIIRKYLDHLPVYLYRNRGRALVCPAWLPLGVRRDLIEKKDHIVHLHWVTFGFINIKTISMFKSPIVWTMHDMWPFTGGCHYDSECGRYKSHCGRCPVLGSKDEHDLSYRTFLRKKKFWRNLNITLVSPSRWLAECAENSTILGRYRTEIIPNGINTEKYRPIEKGYARKHLGLPLNKKLVLFGALAATSDPRKGFNLLDSAIKKIEQNNSPDQAEIIIYGTEGENIRALGNVKRHYLGKIEDEEKLVLLYSAADVFVAPSLQDNLPNTVMEALACGTPCVAFDIGGMPDMIEHKKNGYLAKPYSYEDLANGIKWVLSDSERLSRLSDSAREKILRCFEINAIADKYIELYSDIVS